MYLCTGVTTCVVISTLTRNDDVYCGFLCWSDSFYDWRYWFLGQSIIREVATIMPNNYKNLCTSSTKKRIFGGNEIGPVVWVKGMWVIFIYTYVCMHVLICCFTTDEAAVTAVAWWHCFLTVYIQLTVGCVAQLVERRSLTGELSLSHARPVADGRPLTTHVGKPSAIGQPIRPTQPFIFSGSINWVMSNFIGCVLVAPSGECSRG